MDGKRAQILRTILALGLAVALGIVSSRSFLAQRTPEPLYPSAGLSRILKLSEINPLLEGSGGDTDVYVFEGQEPGGSLLTHTMKGGRFHLVRYSATGQQLKDIELASVAENLPWHYNGIAVAPDGRIFVTDYAKSKTLVLNSDGGSEAVLSCDNCRAPVGVALAPGGELYVVDFRSRLVHFFEPMF